MKRLYNIIAGSLMTGLLLIGFFSCQDKIWDNYYSKPGYVTDGTILDFLSRKPGYSQFTGLIRKSGYDSILSKGGSFSVFALKNGTLSVSDTSVSRSVLKRLIGMHIIPAEIFREKMNDMIILSLSGKSLRFKTGTDGQKVNNVKIAENETRLINGIIYETENALKPLPNIYDYIMSDPESQYWKSYIDSSYSRKVDPEKNTRIGYDSLGNPVYRPPLIYKLTSDYLSLANIDNENVVSTVFLPGKTCLNSQYSRMLTVREGRTSLIVPKIGIAHGDTTIGGLFIPQKTAYKGDSAMFLDYLLKSVVAFGNINSLGGVYSFKNISGNSITIAQNDIAANSAKQASNGYIYTVNNLNLPEIAFRRPFSFQTSPMVSDPSNPAVQIPNPNITYRNGGNTAIPEVVSHISAYGGKFTRFRFNMIGAEMDVTIPFVTKGNYQVTAITFLEGGSGGIFDVIYGGIRTIRFISNSGFSAQKSYQPIGKIKVAVSGPVKVTFILADRLSTDGLVGGTNLSMSAILLEPASD